jgi:opacity protein-like surface antigen
MKTKIFVTGIVLSFIFSSGLCAQSKVGTTAAQFLGISVGARATGLGGAFGSIADDASALYWNPAGISRLGRSEFSISHTQWLVNTNFNWAGISLALDRNNSIGVHFTQLDYGEDIVTTIDEPMGTGDRWSAMDIAVGVSYARNLTDRFSIGGTAKYINQRIWSESASAFALDIGMLFITNFNDMKLGVSISNFGTEMRMDGKNLSIRYRLDPDSFGSNDAIPGRLLTDSFVLPLFFRVGLSMDIIRQEKNRLLVSSDALYPNDESPYVSAGLEYTWNDMLSVRGGYRSLFIDEPIETWTFGGGVKINFTPTMGVKIDYVYQEFGVFSNIQTFSVGINF